MPSEKSEPSISSEIDRCESGITEAIRRKIDPACRVAIELTVEIKNRFNQLRSQFRGTLEKPFLAQKVDPQLFSQEIDPKTLAGTGIGVRTLEKIQRYLHKETTPTYGDLLNLYKSGELNSVDGIGYVKIIDIEKYLVGQGLLAPKDFLPSYGHLSNGLLKKIQNFFNQKTPITAGGLLELLENKKLGGTRLTFNEIKEIGFFLRSVKIS